jgi:hypothetical protein
MTGSLSEDDPRLKVKWGRPLSIAIGIGGRDGLAGETWAGNDLTNCTKKRARLRILGLAVMSGSGSKCGGAEAGGGEAAGVVAGNDCVTGGWTAGGSISDGVGGRRRRCGL